MNYKFKPGTRGFTLIEMMIVLSIIGILLAVLTPSSGKVADKARDAKVKKDLSHLRTALALYVSDN